MSRMIACLVAALTLPAASVHATLYEFTFGGQITEIEGSVPAPWSGVTFGTPFTVKYVFDSETPDLDPTHDIGEYAILSYSVEMLGVMQFAESGEIVAQNLAADHHFGEFNHLPIGASGDIELAGVGVLTSDDLLLDIELNDWFGAILEIVGDEADFELLGPIDTFSSRIVPAPPGIVVLLGVFGFNPRCGRRRKS
jgi:hypothetical protein